MTWWPWHRRNPTEQDESARRAREHAEQALEMERRRLDEATEVAERLRRWRERNHFADMIAESFRRAGP